MGCVTEESPGQGKSDWGPLSLVGAHCAQPVPPYLPLRQSCPSFLPGAWALADSCNPRDLLVWLALYCMPAAEALLPACLSWGPQKGREVLSRPLLPVSGSRSPWEKAANPRRQICLLPTSSSVRRLVENKARVGSPSHLAWMPRCRAPHSRNLACS